MKKKHSKFDLRKLCLALGLLLLFSSAVLTGYNLYTDWAAGQSSLNVLEQMNVEVSEEPPASQAAEPEYPDYWNGPMPEEEIEGKLYIGSVYIPALGVNLPVHTEWGASLAKTAPCRYLGSAYDGTLIIAGHNYKTHFGKLKELQIGDKVRFTDVKGAVFWYEISGFESIDMYDLEAMEAGDWDLTLFTCDASRVRRITVRCREISRTPPQE